MIQQLAQKGLPLPRVTSQNLLRPQTLLLFMKPVEPTWNPWEDPFRLAP